MKRSIRPLTTIVGMTLIPCLLGLFLWYWITASPFFHKVTPDTPTGMKELRQVVLQGQAITVALDTYKRAYRVYPDSLAKLTPTYLPVSAVSKHWQYTEQDGTLFLYYKLDWDAGVRYEPKQPLHRQWVFDPGDGSQKTQTLPR